MLQRFRAIGPGRFIDASPHVLREKTTECAWMPGWVYNPLRDARLTAAVFLHAWSQWILEVKTHVLIGTERTSHLEDHHTKMGMSAPRLTLSSNWYKNSTARWGRMQGVWMCRSAGWHGPQSWDRVGFSAG